MAKRRKKSKSGTKLIAKSRLKKIAKQLLTIAK